MKKIMLVFGTRPEAIKMAPLAHELRKHSHDFELLTCVTAQHRLMLDQALKVFDIKPDLDFDLMEKGQDLTDITSTVLVKMREVIKVYCPDIILVHGDTTTSFSAALAAFYGNVLVGHVEAGLRTHNIRVPFPEEFNRQIVSKLSEWHFAPTLQSKKNLLSEGVSEKKVCVTGNTVIDALMWTTNKIDCDPSISSRIRKKFDELLSFDVTFGQFVLITGHRRENFGNGILQICAAIDALATKNMDVNFVYPVHLNPSVRKPVERLLKYHSNVHLIEPLEYEMFVYLLRLSYLVLTDSGGIQEEAPSLGKPVLVMRDRTERPEAVAAGTVEMVGADKNQILAGVTKLLNDKVHYEKMSRSHNPYGDGKACTRIAEFLKKVPC